MREISFHEAGVVGDQLTVERVVNTHLSVCNGFTADERMEGMHCEIADWHTELKYLSAGIAD